MIAAADPFAFAHDEQVTLAAALLALIDADLADRRVRPEQAQARASVQRALAELDPAGLEPGGAHRLQDPGALRDRLADVQDTANGIALLVELCACQPWAALQSARRLDSKARARTLGGVADALGGDTRPDDVEQIDRILRHGELSRWWLAVPVAVGVGALAAPAIASAIGPKLGLIGAGGSDSAGKVLAGGRTIITGVGKLTVAGAETAAPHLLSADDLSTQALRAQTRKQRAFVALVTASRHADQAKAQAVINLLHEKVADGHEQMAQLRRHGDAQDEQIKQLQEQVAILTDALNDMDPE